MDLGLITLRPFLTHSTVKHNLHCLEINSVPSTCPSTSHRGMWDMHKYKVVQIWPGRFVCKQVTVCPGHIWTTLYILNLTCIRMHHRQTEDFVILLVSSKQLQGWYFRIDSKNVYSSSHAWWSVKLCQHFVWNRNCMKGIVNNLGDKLPFAEMIQFSYWPLCQSMAWLKYAPMDRASMQAMSSR
jgi:hypothetical protein